MSNTGNKMNEILISCRFGSIVILYSSFFYYKFFCLYINIRIVINKRNDLLSYMGQETFGRSNQK